MSDLDRALGLLHGHEGGWSDHPADRGGKTFRGVTETVFHSWLRSQGRALRPVSTMTKDECRELYRALYWNKVGADRLPWPISYLAFDAAVNSGVSRGAKWVQEGLGVTADGKVGPATIAAANKAVAEGDARKILRIIEARARFLANLVQSKPSQVAFVEGWWVRTLEALARGIVDLVNEGA